MSESRPVRSQEHETDGRVVQLLSAFRDGLGSGAIAHILDITSESLQPSLERLREQELLLLRQQYHSGGWVLATESEETPGKEIPEVWRTRLVDYALSSPGATLPELILSIRHGNPSSGEMSMLLLSAVRLAGEYGEFNLLSGLLMDLMDRDGLTENEIMELLRLFQPRRLRGYSLEKAEKFITGSLPTLREPSGKILAITRLGELQLLRNRSSSAEDHLREALRMSLESGCGEHVPVLLESLGELPMDYQGMTELSSEISSVLEWASRQGDAENLARIRAAAAVAQSGMNMNAIAERTILSAMYAISSLPLPVQLYVEWSRARIYIASGRRKAALNMLQRALMMAESVNDQLTVMEILNALVGEMKERPGYTVRNLISIMRNISRKASASGNVSNRAHALDHLTDMYTRTLQFREAGETAVLLAGISEGGGGSGEETLSEWCSTYIGFLTGEELLGGECDELLPGTSAFLARLAGNEDPVGEAGILARTLVTARVGEKLVYGLVLALESFARGWRKAASTIATALDSSFAGNTEDPFISWKLCVSGILSSREKYSDDFFQSAHVLARQLDRLLPVWLLLRCRISLDLDREQGERAALLLLVAELDQFIMEQLDEEGSSVFGERSGASARLDELRRMAGMEGLPTLTELRDRLGRGSTGTMDRVMEVSDIAYRISGRSEISASLEILGRLLDADRVLGLRISSGEMEIIEGYGSGKWRLPGMETQDAILERPAGRFWIDNFQVTPFGSRRSLVIPLARPSHGGTQKRSLLPDRTTQENYLLVEMDSPFATETDVPVYIMEVLCAQVSAALDLRSRETMAYMDRLTGSVIGYSWTGRLEEMAAGQSEDQSLAVLVLGVDGMKDINGLFGFRVGDSALKILVSTIRGVLRPNDLIGRLRGDMFGVILPYTSEDDARMVAERIAGAVAGVDIRPDRIPVTVSIGLSVSGRSADAHELVLSRAAEAMLLAKARGGNRVLSWSGETGGEHLSQLRMFNTGDPGWDHSVATAVMELLSCREPTLDFICEKLRDALRSEIVFIEDGEGRTAFVGSRLLKSLSGEIGTGKEGGVCFHPSLLGKYDALSSGLKGGGRLMSAWEASGGVSLSVRNVFSALAGLSGLLLGRVD